MRTLFAWILLPTFLMSIQDAYAPPKKKPSLVRNQRGSSIRGPLTQKALQEQCRSFFDAKYYCSTYPEAKESKLKPFDHYMTQGWKELKNPSPKFDTKLYVELYPHLRDVNHLMHYMRQGKFSGQTIQARKVIPLENPKYYLCAASMFRDEARFLKEWLEYHLMLGVEHFYLTNHLSKDNYREVLQPYIDKGLVTLEHEKREKGRHSRNGQVDHRALQHQAYARSASALKDKTEWLLICDTDEFAMPHHESNLPSVLKQYDDYPAVCFPWRLFGTANIARLKKDELLIEKLTLYTGPEAPRNIACKSFVKPRYTKSCDSAHFTNLKSGLFMVDPDKHWVHSKDRYKVWGRNIMQTQTILCFYHYHMRDQKFLYEVKTKWLFNNAAFPGFEKQEAEYNKVEDTSMHRFVPALKKRMGLTSEAAESQPASNEEVS